MMKSKATANEKKRVILSLNAEHGATVFVAGTFNNWDPCQKKLLDKNGNGTYCCALMLSPGTYEYKFKVNDAWIIDQNNPQFTQNSLGTLNSILEVN